MKVSPSTPSGQKLRFALLPLSWIVAFLVVWVIIQILAFIASVDVRSLLRNDTLWPLAVFFPAILLGKTIGLIFTNCFAYCIPSMRRIFDAEIKSVGRRGFRDATIGLLNLLYLLFPLTIAGAAAFLRFR